MRWDGWSGSGDGLLLLGQLVLMAIRPKVAQRFVENTSTASVMNGRGFTLWRELEVPTEDSTPDHPQGSVIPAKGTHYHGSESPHQTP